MRAHDATAWLGSVLEGLRQRLAREEHGGLTLEYVGIGAVVVALVGAVVAAIPDVGDAVVAAITDLLDQIAGG